MPGRSQTIARSTLVALWLTVPLLSGCLGIERSEWAFSGTQITKLEGMDLRGRGVVVGIVDTGIDAEHPALDHLQIAGWADLVANQVNPYDDVGHGTHVAGIVAADSGGGGWFYGADVKGVAPAVSLVVVKACSADECKERAVIDGIDFASSKGAHVIVLSLGGQKVLPIALGPSVGEAVRRATAKGVVVVAAAGNSGTESGDVETPADEPTAIAVGAVDRDKAIAAFSSRGSQTANQGTVLGLGARTDPHRKPELVAPGVGILSTWKDGAYAEADGTSQSAPFVAGIVALLLEARPDLKAGQSGAGTESITTIKNALTQTAAKVSGQRSPHDNAYGYGFVQAKDAYDRLVAS